MLWFNIIIALKTLGAKSQELSEGGVIYLASLSLWNFSMFFILLGLISTFLIINDSNDIKDTKEKPNLFAKIISLESNHQQQKAKELGKKIKILTSLDRTGENFLSNVSLLSITALSIPDYDNSIPLIIYFLILLFIGIVFIKNNLIYVNPTLSVLGYKFYEVTTKEDDWNSTLRSLSIITKELTCSVDAEFVVSSATPKILKIGK